MVNYSQNDPRWKNDKLDGSSWTMGEAGCYVTANAVAATKLGHPLAPSAMLALLEQHKLINANGDITRADALAVCFSDLELADSRNWASVKADLTFFNDAANADTCIIVEIDDSPAQGMQTHFMPVEEVLINDVEVMDVWDGVVRNVSAYGARWNPAVSAPAIIYAAYKLKKKTVAVPPVHVTTPTKPTPSAGSSSWVGKTLYMHPVAIWHVYRKGAQPILSNSIGELLPSRYNHGPGGKPGLEYPIIAVSRYANTVTIKTDTYGIVDVYVDKDAEIL